MSTPDLPQKPLDFAGCDCRHQSFRGRSLVGADFSGADLRGCDFTRANLTGANLTQATLGHTRRQWALRGGVAIAASLISGHAISNLVFGSLGQTPADKAWNYVVALVISLSLAGAMPGFAQVPQPRLRRLGLGLAAIAGGAVMGFFYIGVAFGKQPTWAIVGSVGGGLGLGLLWFTGHLLSRIVSQVISAIAAYGVAFLLGTVAISFVSLNNLGDGLLLGTIALFYLGCTYNLLFTLRRTLAHPGTGFRHAILTHVQFTPAQLAHADLTGAVDRPNFAKTPQTDQFSG